MKEDQNESNTGNKISFVSARTTKVRQVKCTAGRERIIRLDSHTKNSPLIGRQKDPQQPNKWIIFSGRLPRNKTRRKRSCKSGLCICAGSLFARKRHFPLPYCAEKIFTSRERISKIHHPLFLTSRALKRSAVKKNKIAPLFTNIENRFGAGCEKRSFEYPALLCA